MVPSALLTTPCVSFTAWLRFVVAVSGMLTITSNTLPLVPLNSVVPVSSMR